MDASLDPLAAGDVRGREHEEQQRDGDEHEIEHHHVPFFVPSTRMAPMSAVGCAVKVAAPSAG